MANGNTLRVRKDNIRKPKPIVKSPVRQSARKRRQRERENGTR